MKVKFIWFFTKIIDRTDFSFLLNSEPSHREPPSANSLSHLLKERGSSSHPLSAASLVVISKVLLKTCHRLSSCLSGYCRSEEITLFHRLIHHKGCRFRLLAKYAGCRCCSSYAETNAQIAKQSGVWPTQLYLGQLPQQHWSFAVRSLQHVKACVPSSCSLPLAARPPIVPVV